MTPEIIRIMGACGKYVFRARGLSVSFLSPHFPPNDPNPFAVSYFQFHMTLLSQSRRLWFHSGLCVCVCVCVCLSVYLSVRVSVCVSICKISKNLRTDFVETFWKGGTMGWILVAIHIPFPHFAQFLPRNA